MSAPDHVEQAVQQIVRRLVEAYRPQRIILYGSLAYGISDADSDIDLLILKETNDTPLERRLHVRRLVADSSRRIPFSPIVLTPDELEHLLTLSDPFYEEILNRGKLLCAWN